MRPYLDFTSANAVDISWCLKPAIHYGDVPLATTFAIGNCGQRMIDWEVCNGRTGVGGFEHITVTQVYG